MTSRVGNPDTDADRELRSCLELRPTKNFVMVAGAGSGKTTSLVKALEYLSKKRGFELRRRGQKVACITYTEIAVGEISGDVGNEDLFHVSTIHSFLWTVIRPFQKDLQEWVKVRIGEKIAEAEEKIAKPRTQEATRVQLRADIARYREQIEKVSTVARFTYGTGSDYGAGVLGHDDVLKAGPQLIEENVLLRKVIARRFPFIFVDESQDTNPTIVDALRLIATEHDDVLCLGFFGDPMQKIYTTGAGAIALGADWLKITKPENFRCPRTVLRVINAIRSEDDGLEQVGGRTVNTTGQVEFVEGTARMFIAPADDRRVQRLSEVRRWLSDANNDPSWADDGVNGDVRVLVLVHRMAAVRLGFGNVYSALNDNGSTNLKEGLTDGTAWVLRPFVTYLLPLVKAARVSADFEVIAMLRRACPVLSREYLAGTNASAALLQVRKDLSQLDQMLASTATSTVKDILTFACSTQLAELDERFAPYLEGGTVAEDDSDAASIRAFLACAATEMWGYFTYLEEQSPFATQHGIKGAEFQRVLVILDDEEGQYNLYSYGKYFGIEPLSATDKKNTANGIDSVVERTRRLFYVCCSRAGLDLAVVLFAADVERVARAVVSKGLFAPDDVHVLGA